jgi:D-threo-aldose 1-dehydrogenase
MSTTTRHHRPFGATGLRIPPIAFRADLLDNSAHVLPTQTRRRIVGEWFRQLEPPVFIQASCNRSNTQLNELGRTLEWLDVTPKDVVINLKFKWSADSATSRRGDSISSQFHKACDRLKGKYLPRLLTFEFLSNFHFLDDLDALKAKCQLPGIGIALRGIQHIDQLPADAKIDFIELMHGPTVLRHPPDMLAALSELAARQTPVISHDVFHGDFLLGGAAFDGRSLNPDSPADQSLLAWRKAFTSLCHGHGARPAQACIQFAISTPGVTAVAVSTFRPDCVADCVTAAFVPVPNALWASMKEERLLAENHAYLGDAPI